MEIGVEGEDGAFGSAGWSGIGVFAEQFERGELVLCFERGSDGEVDF